MNEVRLTGKILNCYVNDSTGALIVKLAVLHEHIMGRQSLRCESVFNVVMLDKKKIDTIDIAQGDKVMITGYLKVDFKRSAGGNEHQKLMVYATDIELIKQKNELETIDYTRCVLGM